MTIQDYTGAGGGFRRNLDSIEEAVYDARTRERMKQERVTRDRLRKKLERDQEASRIALAEQRDKEARERGKQLKVTVKAQYLASGLMTAHEFEQEWPRLKAQIIQEEINSRSLAQSALPEYANLI